MKKRILILGFSFFYASLLWGQQEISPFDHPPLSHQHALWVNELAKGFFVGTKNDTVETWKRWSKISNLAFGKDRGELLMINDVYALHPFFRDRVLELIKQCKEKGIELAVVETYRSHAKQNEYRAMGKKYTSSAGGKSKHQYGLAVDVVAIIDSVAQWDNVALWKKIGAVGEKLGLRWGGRWRNPYDPGHFEWTSGLSSHHLAQGQLPKVKRPDLYPCLEEDIKRLSYHWSQWEVAQKSVLQARSFSATAN